jgi:arsenate reductase (thioredoxin)
MISSQPRVLFVCSILGARSVAASHFCNEFSMGAIQSVAAGFQKGTFDSKIKEFMQTRGITLPGKSPRDVFSLHRSGECFDYVVTLCNDAAREQCPIFRRSINTLYTEPVTLNWNIPDFMSIEGNKEFILSCWDQIVSDIEAHVRHFVAEVLSAGKQNLGNLQPKG